MIKYEPLFNLVLVEPEADKDRVGMVVIPDSAQKMLRRDIGKVVEVGPGYAKDAGTGLVPMTVKKGDMVYFLPQTVVGWVRGDKGRMWAFIRETELISRVKEVPDEVKE